MVGDNEGESPSVNEICGRLRAGLGVNPRLLGLVLSSLLDGPGLAFLPDAWPTCNGLALMPTFLSTPRILALELNLLLDGLAPSAIRPLLGLNVIAINASALLLPSVGIGVESQAGIPKRVGDGPVWCEDGFADKVDGVLEPPVME